MDVTQGASRQQPKPVLQASSRGIMPHSWHANGVHTERRLWQCPKQTAPLACLLKHPAWACLVTPAACSTWLLRLQPGKLPRRRQHGSPFHSGLLDPPDGANNTSSTMQTTSTALSCPPSGLLRPVIL